MLQVVIGYEAMLWSLRLMQFHAQVDFGQLYYCTCSVFEVTKASGVCQTDSR